MRVFTALSLFFLLSLTPCLGFADSEVKFDGGSVRIISAESALSLNGKTAVAIHFRIDPNWHIYWKNPGEMGMATTVNWQLADGLSAAETSYPVPQKFESFGFVSFGYEKEVIFTTLVSPSASLDSSLPVQLGAEVNWVLCGSECRPGNATLALSLPVTKGIASEGPDAELIRAFQKQIPEHSPGASAKLLTDSIVLNLPVRLASQVEEVVFFPESRGVVDIKKPVTLNRGNDLLSVSIPVSTSNKASLNSFKGVLALGASQPSWSVELDLQGDTVAVFK